MTVRIDLLSKELDKLHRGRGLNALGVTNRLGPLLSALIFGDNEPNESLGRGLISAYLFDAARTLQPDLERVFLAGLAVGDDSPYLTTRLENVGIELDRSPRTIVRRLREANHAIAQVLERRTRISEDGNPLIAKGWYVDRIESCAIIGDRPQFIAIRDIKVTHDGVATLCESFSVPHILGGLDTAEIEVEPIEGCERLEIDRYSASSWLLTMHLPRSFRTGETHRVGVSVTMPSRNFIRPYNALAPVRRTRSFRASVRFEDDTEVKRVWRYDGVPPPVIEDRQPTAHSLTPDDDHIVVADWPNIRQGLAYGIAWA
ncbi:hypothetical protein EV649_5061 [Kribbella sp. VKM Ac-2569]|uniref:hypothetical protein n=1 Tax=Kribbella sp. VKM Ac-2569 TaxID=2512220 RepID=UPI00102C3D11|nr:hypothetical protein [Kribbella sp. VKM Ac-2569]RZT17514.1 hypothetical protein EV649_5061 [Kribbella sp. VKM Ac-2569]